MPEPVTKRTPRSRLNLIFDRWRGPLLLLGPVVITVFTALGFELVVPSGKIAALADTVAVLKREVRQYKADQDTLNDEVRRTLGFVVVRLCLDSSSRDRALMRIDCREVQRSGGVLPP